MLFKNATKKNVLEPWNVYAIAHILVIFQVSLTFPEKQNKKPNKPGLII